MDDLSVTLITPWKQKGGIANYSSRLVEELQNKGISIDIVPIPGQEFRNPFWFGKLIEKIPAETDVIHVQFEAGLFGRLGMSGVGAPWFFHRLHKVEAPVVTTLHEVHARHDHRGLVGDWLLRARDRIIERLALRASESVVVHTKAAERVLRTSHGTRREVRRMLLPAEKNKSATPAAEAKAAFGLDGPVILTFGWIEEKKRFTDIVRVLPDLPNATYFVVGDPRPGQEDTFERARTLAKELGVSDRVVRHGYVSGSEFDDVFGAADVVVLPYRRVSVSIAVNDALAYHRPTVTTRLPYFEELNEEYNCLLTYENKQELLDALEQAIYDEKVRSRLSQAARDYVDEVNWESFAVRTSILYNRLI